MIWPDRLTILVAFLWAVIVALVAYQQFNDDLSRLLWEPLLTYLQVFAIPVAVFWVFVRLVRFVIFGKFR